MANSRSTYRRGGGNYKGHHTNTSPASKGRDFHEGLGKATAALEIPEDNDEDEGLSEITIKKFAYAGSYNWIEAKQPTILVPGAFPDSFLKSHADDNLALHRLPTDMGRQTFAIRSTTRQWTKFHRPKRV